MWRNTRLTQVPGHHVQESGYISEAARRHLLNKMSCPSQEMPGGESNEHGAEDPQH